MHNPQIKTFKEIIEHELKRQKEGSIHRCKKDMKKKNYLYLQPVLTRAAYKDMNRKRKA